MHTDQQDQPIQSHLPTAEHRVALVHDYLTQRGGAERVALLLTEIFPDAPLYTSLYEPSLTYPEFSSRLVFPSAINRIALLRRSHRLALPLLAPSFSAMRVPAAVTIVSSSGWAHGAKTTGRKVVYCHAPARWLYQRELYLKGISSARRSSILALGGKAALGLLSPTLKSWDRRVAHLAHRYLANSRVTAERIERCYGISAEVLPPPPALQPDGAISPVRGLEPGFLLCVSRLLPYKNVGAVIGAAACLGRRLVVVGDGPLRGELEHQAGRAVTFLGTVEDARLRWLYKNCAALVSASYEDFGLTPLEANTFGRPAITLRGGGFLDTVIEGVNGLFFDEPTPTCIADAIRRFDTKAWNATEIQSQANKFSRAAFASRLRTIVEEELASYEGEGGKRKRLQYEASRADMQP